MFNGNHAVKYCLQEFLEKSLIMTLYYCIHLWFEPIKRRLEIYLLYPEENFQEEKLNRSQNLFFFPKRYICFEQIFFFFHNEPPYGLFETD